MRDRDALTRIRFLQKVKIDPDGCWIWEGRIGPYGYGIFDLDGRPMNAHRAALILFAERVPDRAHVHHVCKNKLCVRWSHMEVLGPSAHAQLECEDGPKGQAAHNKWKTHCVNGHPFAGSNLRMADGGKRRRCIVCMRETAARNRAANPGRKIESHRKTHCKHGHLLSEENVYVAKNGSRSCKTCLRDNVRRYQARKKNKT